MKGHPNIQYQPFQWCTQKANWCSPFSQRCSLQETEFGQKTKTKCRWTAAFGVDMEKFLFVSYRRFMKETILFS